MEVLLMRINILHSFFILKRYLIDKNNDNLKNSST